MSEYQNFVRRDLEDGCLVCEDVHLPSGSVCTVYISSNSIYVLSQGRTSPETRYREIQDILGAVRIRLYILPSANQESGLYDPLTNTLGQEMDEQALAQDVSAWLYDGRVIYAASAKERMVSRLQSADVQARGYAVSENGEIFLLRNGKVRKASPASSELQFYLTLFFGPLGLHRMALGKVYTGFLYLFTGGLFLSGWLVDLIQVLGGFQKDSQKRYLLPLKNRKGKLLILPIGLAAGAVIFTVYLKISELFGLGLENAVMRLAKNIDPIAFENLLNKLADGFPR